MNPRLRPLLGLPLALSLMGNPGPAWPEEILQQGKNLQPRWVEFRRKLHRMPELSNREKMTGALLAQELRALGLEVRTGLAGHGVLGLLKGGKPGPVVVVRADTDALPVQEATGCAFQSQNTGVMHACGHDVHMTCALGAAQLLKAHQDQLPGTVLFLFQPAEEGPPAGEEGGARLIIKEGVLQAYHPKAFLALHVDPAHEAGTVGACVGPATAGVETFSIRIQGRMAHGATPHKGVDAILASAQLILALQSIPSRKVDAQDPVVLTVGTIQGGQRHNVLAEEVTLTGTLRTFSPTVRKQVLELMGQSLEGTARATGTSIRMEFVNEGFPSVQNDPKLALASLEALKGIPGLRVLRQDRPWMASEDFALYGDLAPTFMAFLGVSNRAKGLDNKLHSPTFDVDESCLGVGAKALAILAWEVLQGGEEKPQP